MAEPSDPPFQLTGPLLAVWREPGVLHLGLDGRSFVLTGVPRQLKRALELFAEPRTLAQVAARLPGLERGWLEWLCQHLSTAGVLTPVHPAVRRDVLVFGGGQLAIATTAALRAGGLRPGHLRPADVDTLRPGSLVVVATETAEPDRTLLNRLCEARTEHLVVRAEPARVVVGPFVAPGAGACVRCDDLARAELDRAWPLLLARLCTTSVQPDIGLAHWAAATAAAQVRGRLRGCPSELSGRSLELGSDDFRLRTRRWPTQPACGYHGDGFSAAGTLAG